MKEDTDTVEVIDNIPVQEATDRNPQLDLLTAISILSAQAEGVYDRLLNNTGVNVDRCWLEMGKVNLQTSLMFLRRAVIRPGHF